MYSTKLIIPRISDHYKLYIYRSRSSESINTISKVKELQPVIIIDESVCKSKIMQFNGKDTDCYEVIDNQDQEQEGVQYIGPNLNIVPTTFYETQVNVLKLNDYTYVNTLSFNELENNFDNGVMMYYSVIGVDETNNIITHLSKVNGVIIKSDFKKNGTRYLYSCDDIDETEQEWKYVSSVGWNEKLTIGNINNSSSISRFGIPMVEKVKSIPTDKITVSTRPVTNENFMVLEILNPWQFNNKEYNFRKLKSYKLCNIENEQYSDYSEPTFQSLLPVSIEKMIILKKTDPDNPDEIIPLSEITENETTQVIEVIRKDGLFYNSLEHKKYGLNKYNIPLEENIAIFNEASVQDKIKIQTEALPVHVYSFTIYLIDVYGNVSEPTHFVATT